MPKTSVDILLVEDNPADVLLAEQQFEALAAAPRVHAVADGEEALRFLRRTGEHAGAPRPELVLLDLNLPGLSGHGVLQEIKSDADLCTIPVVIHSCSDATSDIDQSYRHHASAYIKKADTLEGLARVVASIQSFWLEVAELPAVR